MTTTVKRGAGRPAAEAKRKKHAQRNPVLGGKRDNSLKEAAMPKVPTPKFTVIGKGKFVHVIHTEKYDREKSGCQQVRKALVAGKINYKSKGLSPEAALALEPCTNCGTSEVAKRMLPAESKRENAKDKRDDVLRRAKGESLSDRARKNRVTIAAETTTKAKRDKPAKEAKPKPERKAAKTKAGTRSTGSGIEDKALGKAQELVTFAEANGWSAEIVKDDDTGHWCVVATKDEKTINAWYIDGKYDINRHAEIVVGTWSGKLRGAHAARRQMDASLDDRDRPHPVPGRGRAVVKRSKAVATTGEADEAKDESDDDMRKRVPFSLDDEDIVIIDALKGRKIFWRNTTSGALDDAMIPSSVGNGKRPFLSITTHPKTGARMLDFLEVVDEAGGREVVGPERVVRLDKIIRVE